MNMGPKPNEETAARRSEIKKMLGLLGFLWLFHQGTIRNYTFQYMSFTVDLKSK